VPPFRKRGIGKTVDGGVRPSPSLLPRGQRCQTHEHQCPAPDLGTTGGGSDGNRRHRQPRPRLRVGLIVHRAHQRPRRNARNLGQNTWTRRACRRPSAKLVERIKWWRCTPASSARINNNPASATRTAAATIYEKTGRRRQGRHDGAGGRRPLCRADPREGSWDGHAATTRQHDRIVAGGANVCVFTPARRVYGCKPAPCSSGPNTPPTTACCPTWHRRRVILKVCPSNCRC